MIPVVPGSEWYVKGRLRRIKSIIINVLMSRLLIDKIGNELEHYWFVYRDLSYPMNDWNKF